MAGVERGSGAAHSLRMNGVGEHACGYVVVGQMRGGDQAPHRSGGGSHDTGFGASTRRARRASASSSDSGLALVVWSFSTSEGMP